MKKSGAGGRGEGKLTYLEPKGGGGVRDVGDRSIRILMASAGWSVSASERSMQMKLSH